MINAAHLSVCFVLHYHVFFRKEIYFPNVYVSVNTIFERLDVFWLRKGLWIKYVRNWWGNGGSSKMHTALYRGRGFHATCVRTQLHNLCSCFWHHFCLLVPCFCCINSTLPLFKKYVFVRNGYFSPSRSISVAMK